VEAVPAPLAGGRVAQPSDLAGRADTVGAPSLAYFAKGGQRCCPRYCVWRHAQKAIAGARASDNVHVMTTVSPMQAVRRDQTTWYRQHRTRPCKERKDGAPTYQFRERKHRNPGQARATRPWDLFVGLRATGYVRLFHDSTNEVQLMRLSYPKPWGTYLSVPESQLPAPVQNACSETRVTAKSNCVRVSQPLSLPSEWCH
jgi:hypothetical protein